MPEPGQTPTPQIKQGKGPDALPWGEAAQINDAVGLIPPPDEEDFQPQGDGEQFLYSPTDRPQEPATHGLPYGPGAGALPPEDDNQFSARVIRQIDTVPNPPKELRAFVAKMAEGV